MSHATHPPPPRLTLRFLLRESAQRFLNLEHGWLRTVRELFTQPGPMIRRYLRHDRKSYANPLSYLVLGTALNILVQSISGIQQRMMEGSATSPGQLEFAQRLVGIVQQNFLYVSFFILIPFAMLLRLFFRRSGFNLAEMFVFGFFASGHTAIMGLVTLLLALVVPIPAYLLGLFGFLLNLTYYSYAAVGFFGGRIKTVIKTCLAFFLSTAAFFVLLVVAATIYVLNFGPSFVSGEAWNLVTLAEKNMVAEARSLLAEDIDVDMTLLRTPLHVAADAGHVEMVELLLEHGADVNARDHLGRVPMYVALMSHHETIAWRLAKAGTDATVLTKQGASLLILAVRREETALVRWLLEKGADVNAMRRDNPRATALMAAAAADNMELIELLFEHGANPNLTNEDGETALELARDPAIKNHLRKTSLP